MAELWTTESVLKKHNLWRELAGPLAGPTAITLQFQDTRIAALEARCRELEADNRILRDMHKIAEAAGERFEDRIEELEAALKLVACNCNGEAGCKSYELYYKLCPASETAVKP